MKVNVRIYNDAELMPVIERTIHRVGFVASFVGEMQNQRYTSALRPDKGDLYENEISGLCITDRYEFPANGLLIVLLVQRHDSSGDGDTDEQGQLASLSLEVLSSGILLRLIYMDYDDLAVQLRALLFLIRVGIQTEQQRSLFYQAVTQYSHDGIICVDKDGIVTVFNQRASEVLGVPMNQALGHPLVSFNPTAGLPRVLKQREIELEDVISVNGRQVAANRVPIMVDGEIVGAISTFQDVTQLQQYEQIIRRKLNAGGFEAKFVFEDIVATAEATKRVKELAYRCGRVDATVLITGESGTGKEMFAQSMHNVSFRARGPFVAVNCAALPESLLESELFGYDEGAFTGAQRGGKQGLFELAHGGTLFLDEIGELPLGFQGRLLRVLQEREVLRVGGKVTIPVDVRIMAATNQPLLDWVKQGRFRVDLFYRLNVLSINVPPLRDRREDILPLARSFFHSLSGRYHKGNLHMSHEVLKVLEAYDWPGNVRELHNVMERAVVMTPEHGEVLLDPIFTSGNQNDDEKQRTDVPLMLGSAKIAEVGHAWSVTPGNDLSASEREFLKVYSQTGSVSACAQQLGVHRTTVWRRLQRMRERVHSPHTHRG